MAISTVCCQTLAAVTGLLITSHSEKPFCCFVPFNVGFRSAFSLISILEENYFDGNEAKCSKDGISKNWDVIASAPL